MYESPTEKLLLTLIAKLDDNSQQLDRITHMIEPVITTAHSNPLEPLRVPTFLVEAEARQIKKLIEDIAASQLRFVMSSTNHFLPNVRILCEENIHILRRNGFTVTQVAKPTFTALHLPRTPPLFDIRWTFPESMSSLMEPQQ